MLKIQEMAEWRSANDELSGRGWAMSIRHATHEYVAEENESVRWGRIEDLREHPQGVPSDVICHLLRLASAVRMRSCATEDIRVLGIEMYPGEWEFCPRGLNVEGPECYEPTEDELACPRCQCLLDFSISQNTDWQVEGRTGHYCPACGETFWADSNRNVIPWEMIAFGPIIVNVNDFSHQEMSRHIADYKFRKLLDGVDEDVSGSTD